jgi:S-adenosyl methyltransferase
VPQSPGGITFMSRTEEPGSPGPLPSRHVAHAARVCNFWLGGKDHYAADRAAGEAVIRLRPQIAAGARANRYFLARVMRYLAADAGIRQFIDIGPGLPAADNTHEIAQRIAPDCRVVYADNDPMVMAHARALLTGPAGGSCGHVLADLRDPTAILQGAAQTLDLTQPTAVLMLAVLQLIPGAANPASLVAHLASALPPASHIVISHMTADFAPGPVTAAIDAYNALTADPVTLRTHAKVTALFSGLRLVAPGVVPINGWRADIPASLAQPADLYGGVARTTGKRW